jgi:hypothetical protein
MCCIVECGLWERSRVVCLFSPSLLIPSLLSLLSRVCRFEWPILRGFDLAHFRPKLVIVEIQEKQARYAQNERVQKDARDIEAAFAKANYSILYRDIVNTVFIDRNVECVGGD